MTGTRNHEQVAVQDRDTAWSPLSPWRSSRCTTSWRPHQRRASVHCGVFEVVYAENFDTAELCDRRPVADCLVQLGQLLLYRSHDGTEDDVVDVAPASGMLLQHGGSRVQLVHPDDVLPAMAGHRHHVQQPKQPDPRSRRDHRSQRKPRSRRRIEYWHGRVHSALTDEQGSDARWIARVRCRCGRSCANGCGGRSAPTPRGGAEREVDLSPGP